MAKLSSSLVFVFASALAQFDVASLPCGFLLLPLLQRLLVLISLSQLRRQSASLTGLCVALFLFGKTKILKAFPLQQVGKFFRNAAACTECSSHIEVCQMEFSSLTIDVTVGDDDDDDELDIPLKYHNDDEWSRRAF